MWKHPRVCCRRVLYGADMQCGCSLGSPEAATASRLNLLKLRSTGRKAEVMDATGYGRVGAGFPTCARQVRREEFLGVSPKTTAGLPLLVESRKWRPLPAHE